MTMSSDSIGADRRRPTGAACTISRRLKLGTFAREYEKVAMESAQDRATSPALSAASARAERIDREHATSRPARRHGFHRPRASTPLTSPPRSSPTTRRWSLNRRAANGLEKRQRKLVSRWAIRNRQNLHRPGTGLAACQENQSVAFTTAAALVHELMEGVPAANAGHGHAKHLNAVKLLIVDELGYVPFTAVGSELLFEVFSQRYERGATLVTSNLPFDEWDSIFGLERLTGALLDRAHASRPYSEMNGGELPAGDQQTSSTTARPDAEHDNETSNRRSQRRYMMRTPPIVTRASRPFLST